MFSKLKNQYLFVLLIVATGCQHTLKNASETSEAKLELFTLENPPLWGKTSTGVSIFAGGFSGLIFLGKTSDNEFEFLTNTDRGPNGETLFVPNIGPDTRPFLLPSYQPRWVKFRTQRDQHRLQIVQEILLTDPNGNPLTGVPQSPPPGNDENAADLNGARLPADLMGIDPESLVKDDHGFYWMGEEYRPSLLKLSSDGKLVKRYIPKNSLSPEQMSALQKKYGKGVVVESLPESYRFRKSNRGFESLSFKNGKIYALLQSPLDHPKAVHKKVVRLLEFEITTEKVTAQYLFPLQEAGVDKIGDLAISASGSEFFVIEQNSKSGKSGIHYITKFALSNPTTEADPETTAFSQLADHKQLLVPKRVLSLTSIGYDFADKIEGLALVSDRQMAIVNDNDFGIDGDLDLATKMVPINPQRKTVLGIFTIPTDIK